jgi:hypothetical protein
MIQLIYRSDFGGALQLLVKDIAAAPDKTGVAFVEPTKRAVDLFPSSWVIEYLVRLVAG